MPNAWDHLPNAKYIDLVLASLKANPDEWDTAWDAASLELWSESWSETRGVVRNAARCEVYNATWDKLYNAGWRESRNTPISVAQDASRDTAQDAILALLAYDDCAHMLDSEPDDLRILSKLGSHAATLMISASIAFKLIRQKALVVL